VRSALTIASYGVRRLLRDRIAVFFVFLLPFLIIVVIGLGARDEEMLVGYVDGSGDDLALELRERIDAGENVELRSYSGTESLLRAVRHGAVSGGIVIPPGYGDDLRSGRTAVVTAVLDQSDPGSTAVRTVVSAAVADQAAVVQAVLFTGETFDQALPTVANLATGALGGVTTTSTGDDPFGALDVLSYITFGELILFVFLSSMTGAGDLVEARRLGIIRRSYAAPVRAGSLLAGQGATYFGVALLQTLLIVGVTATVIRVHWGSLVGLAVVMAAFALVASGVGMLTGTIARTNEQATSVGPPVGIALAMLGGCMWPLEVVSPTMQTIGHATPHAWALDAMIELAGKDGGLSDVAAEVGVLLCFAAAFLVAGTWRLRRTITG